MDDRLSLILQRRSIRRYLDRPIEEDKVELLLRAAMAAPSAGNRQPWHFVVITKRETMERMVDVHPYARMLREAPLCIAVCGEPDASAGGSYWVQDCSAAMENLLLAAVGLDLGAVWLGVHTSSEREQRISELLGLPGEIRPLGLAAVGYPAEEKPAHDRYSAEKVHRERFG